MKNTVRSLTALFILFLFSMNCASAQFQYIFPKDGAINEIPYTHLILRNGAFMDPTSVTSDKITLTGSISGAVTPNVVLSTDGKTVCITPSVPFAYSETVTVNVSEGLKTTAGQSLAGTSFKFSIRREMTMTEKQQLQEYLNTHDGDGNLLNDRDSQSVYIPYDHTIRDNFNFINLYTNTTPAPGNIFFHRNSGSSPTTSSGIGYGIMTPSADSIFYRASTVDGANFHLNLNGYLTALRLDPGVDTGVLVMDSSYTIIDVVNCQGGFTPTQHEQLFYPNGNKWFTIYDWQAGWDLSSFGGSSSATVNVSRIQAIDAANNIIFSWRSDDDFQVTDAAPDILLSTPTVDPWHLNSLYVENDGLSVIASFRNMDRIIKLGVPSGNMIWQWGGINSTVNDFVTTDCANHAFSHQHHVHRIENGHILMFDNGTQGVNQISQPKEYALDETNHTANCVWYYAHPQVNGFTMFTKNQGSAQRLPNGNTIIGYGLPFTPGLPNGAEIDGTGAIVWEFRFKDSTEYTYRLYKDLWDPNVGIADVNGSKNNIDVFPNPGNGLVNLNIDLPVAAIAKISVLNLLGQTMYSKSESYHSGINTEALDLTALNKGFYILQVEVGDRKMVGRILIQ